MLQWLVLFCFRTKQKCSFHVLFPWGRRIPGSLLMELRNVLIFFPEMAWVQLPESQGLAAWECWLTGLRGFLTAGLDCRYCRWGCRYWREMVDVLVGWPFLLEGAVLCIPLLISCFLLAGLMAHQPVFLETSPQESLVRSFAAESFVISWQCLTFPRQCLNLPIDNI